MLGRPAVDLDIGQCLARVRLPHIGAMLALSSVRLAIKALCAHRADPGAPLISLLFGVVDDAALVPARKASPRQALRAQIAIIMFAAAYIAETVRGGLQAIPKGQRRGFAGPECHWQQPQDHPAAGAEDRDTALGRQPSACSRMSLGSSSLAFSI